MKKITHIVFIVLFTFLIPQLSFATQGACSYHGGVNCSLSQFSNGKVVCNDGWENSSVNYSDSIMCQDKSDSCPAYYDTKTYNYLISEIDRNIQELESNKTYNSVCENIEQEEYQTKQKIYDSCANLQSTINKFANQTGGTQNTQSDCGNLQISQITANYSRIKLQCSQQKTQTEKYKLKYINLRNCIKDEKELLPQKDMFCDSKFGNANYNPNTYSCICKVGYELINGKCEDINTENTINSNVNYYQPLTQNQKTRTETIYKAPEQTKNTITLKEAIQRRKDIANNKENVNLPEILKESTSTIFVSTTTNINTPYPTYKKIFTKIKNWFRF